MRSPPSTGERRLRGSFHFPDGTYEWRTIDRSSSKHCEIHVIDPVVATVVQKDPVLKNIHYHQWGTNKATIVFSTPNFHM
jgi:hypothetical protein